MPDKPDHSRKERVAPRPAPRHPANDAIDANPFAILAGGIAVGALAGALIPRSVKEKELLAPVGREIGQRATAAIDAARAVGKDEFAELGLTKGAAKNQVKTLLAGVAKAVSTAGAAAAKGASTKG